MGKGEFERIDEYFAPLAADFPGALGLSDDAALISLEPGHSLVVTTDTIVEGVHYIGDEGADLIARKLLRVSLSDLASMGATPHAYTLNIALPEKVSDDWLARFVEGLRRDQAEYKIHLAGGDSVSTTGPVVLTATLYGIVPDGQALRRNGARIGDGIYVSGTIGDGALGLMVARGSVDLPDREQVMEIVDRYRLPRPRIALGGRLTGIATAAADVSDGLLADLGHIADTSKVGAEIELSQIPLSSGARQLLDGQSGLMEAIVAGGDDYELIFTSAEDEAVRQLSNEIGLPISRIGRIVEGRGVKALDAQGNRVPIEKQGFRHV